jgi:ABC-type nitrate/sulfonate/bicarbonate transport system substrate-binding protein
MPLLRLSHIRTAALFTTVIVLCTKNTLVLTVLYILSLYAAHYSATELLFVIDGEDLQTAFVEENGGRAIVNHISTGQVDCVYICVYWYNCV